ncbi:tetratricopeptide repeat protein [Xylella fastidiosa subsp. sandyi]|uniref:tetratricopeptide repeat protein n=1 Tax=Xylella fastidiosa TaxID=2371 RepID=UPI0007077FA9|nr:tetratricopeptide repeat protein [Xylella fastidiosa]KQH73202.1 adenylate cyclase [Xylella fastidiosa]RWA43963.1 adenylate cyclase [Xylella fastidiosa subsp. sandyi]WNY18150.1 tetratricopeptide repeat protein [Xylella fastidiosa]WNY20436.1 tetratricopeptide repeat protein [Xylella fastidiosa]
MQDQIIDALHRQAHAEALSLARAWCASAPGEAQAQRWLAAALQQYGEHKAALAASEAALALAPELPELHLQHGLLLLAQHDLSGADAALSRSTRLDPNQFNTYVMQAHLAIARGALDEAEQLSRTAARIISDHPQLLAVNATITLHRGQVDQALAMLSQAVELLPEEPAVLFSLGFAYLQKGHIAFAERAFQHVIELNPHVIPVRALIAQLAQRQGRLDDALRILEEALSLPEGDTPALHRLTGEFELMAGNPDRALPHLRQVLATWPEDPRTLEALLTAWKQLDMDDDARVTLDAALDIKPRNHDLWLARLSVAPVGSDEARIVIERWLSAMPEHLPALETLMSLHDIQNNPEAAETVARQIVAIEPGRLSGEQRIVEALLQRDPPAAVACLQQLIESVPEHERTILRPWLGLVQDRAGQFEAALATWLQFQAEQAKYRLPLPPQTWTNSKQWPDLAAIPAETLARPLLIWGPPGSHVERVTMMMAWASSLLCADRYSETPPADPLQRYETVSELTSGTLAPQALIDAWRQQLPARGIEDGNVIDWLLWWDNSLLTALRPHLPEGRLIIVLRDPRDMLLDWIAYGSPIPLALDSLQHAANWLGDILNQIAALHELDLYPHHLIRLDGIEDNPQALATTLENIFGDPFPIPPSLEAPRLPAGRWRDYREVLSSAFDAVLLAAMRLGYPFD